MDFTLVFYVFALQHPSDMWQDSIKCLLAYDLRDWFANDLLRSKAKHSSISIAHEQVSKFCTATGEQKRSVAYDCAQIVFSAQHQRRLVRVGSGKNTCAIEFVRSVPFGRSAIHQIPLTVQKGDDQPEARSFRCARRGSLIPVTALCDLGFLGVTNVRLGRLVAWIQPKRSFHISNN
jgi:hypothetical protein